ncbi:hypothetical protein quinque_001397 [Culex quinquefasciatus]
MQRAFLFSVQLEWQPVQIEPPLQVAQPIDTPCTSWRLVAEESVRAGMGKLMAASHNSLRDDFEVSCHEVDILVEATLGAPGVLGTLHDRGGFGGCTVTLVQKELVEDAVKTIDTIYSRKVGGKFKARFFLAEPAEGARVINLRAY